MSNVAYMIPRGKFPGVDAVEEVLRGVLHAKFSMLMMERTLDDTGWVIAHHSHHDFALNVWLTDFPGKKPRRAIQFPHGHRYNALWWVEYELREAVGRAFDARSYDEGTGLEKVQQESYATYSDYIRAGYPPNFLRHQVGMVRCELDVLPEDFRPLMGDLFE